MPAIQTLAVLGCISAIALGAAGLGAARLMPENGLSIASVSGSAQQIPRPQLAQIEQLPVAAVNEPRGSLYYWRETNARRAGRAEQGAFIIPDRPTLPVTAERLAYERELFSRDVKDNMLVARETPAKLASAPTTGSTAIAKQDAMAMASAGDERAALPQKPKKKRIVRARPDPRVLAYDARFGAPFGMW